jgi:hypothetical protein
MIEGIPPTLLEKPLIAAGILALVNAGVEMGVLHFGHALEEARMQLTETARERFNTRTGWY